VKLTSVAVFAAGYVIGSKAGHERYAQIIHGMAKASQRLEEFSSRPPPSRHDECITRTDSRSRSRETLI
jgi:hypothetical protein